MIDHFAVILCTFEALYEYILPDEFSVIEATPVDILMIAALLHDICSEDC
jgi:hypothetical protein